MYHDEEYLGLVKYILDEGVVKDDRTGTGTLSVFAQQMRFDLSDGSIPLLTTKKMHTKSIIHELLWFLQGTGSGTYLKENNIRIWDEWMDSDNYLGPCYGKLWRSFPPASSFKPVKNKFIVDNTEFEFIYDKPNILEKGKYGTQCFKNIEGYDYEVLGVDGYLPCRTSEIKTYTIRFLNSGWVKQHVTARQLRKGNFRDQSLPSVYGVGALGNYKNKNESFQHKKLRKTWEGMISRCYNSNNTSYNTYGNINVIVCNRWKILSNFIEDVKKMKNWFEKKSNMGTYVLDKDYYGSSKIYHPESCVWLLREHNNLYRKDSIPVKLTSANEILYFPCISTASKFLGTSITPIVDRIRKASKKKLKGYEIEKFVEDSYSIRNLLHVDQIADIIKLLNNNPDSRRIILSAWHPSLIPDDSISPKKNASLGMQSLPPCHYFAQFWVGNGKLSLLLNMRSNDLFLGNPFNIAQYSILLHMIAQVTNLKPGELVFSGGDIHIYKNHIEQCEEQLTRQPYPSPKLLLNKEIDEIDNFRFDDFEIVNYKSHPSIKGEVAV